MLRDPTEATMVVKMSIAVVYYVLLVVPVVLES